GDYNERRPHSALAMMAPAKFARAWRQAATEGKVIPFTDPAKALSMPKSASISRPSGESRPNSPPGPDHDAPVLLRSPYGLAPQHSGSPTLHPNNTHQLSQQVDHWTGSGQVSPLAAWCSGENPSRLSLAPFATVPGQRWSSSSWPRRTAAVG